MASFLARSFFLAALAVCVQGCDKAGVSGPVDESELRVVTSPKDSMGKETFLNSVIVQADGQTFAYSTPKYAIARRTSANGIRSTQLEIADGDKKVLSLVMHAPADRSGLAGQYTIVPAGTAGAKAKPDTAEFTFTYLQDAERGRQILPGGGGSLTVMLDGKVHQLVMVVQGDGAFRPVDADPMRVQVSLMLAE